MTSGSLPRVRAARTCLFGLIDTQNGLLRTPPPQKKLRNSGRPREGLSRKKSFPPGSNLGRRMGFFLSTGPQRLWNMGSPAHRSFAEPSSDILGSKLCTSVTIRFNFPFYPFLYGFLIFSFCYSILILFSPSFSSSYSSRTILRLILLFFYFKLLVVLQTFILIIWEHIKFVKNLCLMKMVIFMLAKHISAILRCFSRGPSLFYS